MQEVYNQGWYSGNESVKYPLHIDATGISDSGDSLPSEIISDIRIISTKKKTFFISGVTCSEYLISIVIASSDGLEAAITLTQPVEPLSHHALECFNDGISGVIAIGHPFTYGQWRFSSPSQSKLDPSSNIILNSWPVTSIGCRDKLLDEVTFTGGNDISVDVETFTISETRTPKNTFSTKAIVFRLDENINNTDNGRSKYLSDCAVRPDNGECDYITSLGGAEPDCNGNINITFTTDSDTSDRFTNKIKTTSCGITLTTTETHVEKEEASFGQCGDDLCNPETTQVYTALAPNPSVSFEDDVLPLEGYTIGYSEGKLFPPEGEETYCYTEYTGNNVTAVFRRNGICGIVWDMDGSFHKLLYNGTKLYMDNQYQEAESAISKVTLSLSCSGNTITGKLTGIPVDYTNNNTVTLAELSTTGSTLGKIGIYMKDSTCIEWSIQ